jgi:hypothetical protein
MSWKSLVTAAVLCVIASPAFAVPALSVTKGGDNATSNNYLNTGTSQLVWNVQIAPTDPIPTGSSPLAAELGFTVSANTSLVAAASLSTGAGDDFDTNNPGTSIFGWEVTGGAATNGKPEGVQINAGTRQVFSALGSQIYTTTGAKDYIKITTGRPVITQATPGLQETYTITVSGAYGGKGRIAEAAAGTPPSTNHDVYNNVFSRTIKGGDTDLDSDVDFTDYQILSNAYPGTGVGQQWYDGDYDNTGDVDFTDYQILANNYPSTYVIGPGAGAGGGLSGGSVPEPASAVLVGLGLLGGLGFLRRKR